MREVYVWVSIHTILAILTTNNAIGGIVIWRDDPFWNWRFSMSSMPNLFEAFRHDHAVLGMGFHEISTLLRAGDGAAARRVAMRLDRDAGPHIAFEESRFYPLLRKSLGDEEVDRLYREHKEGLTVLHILLDASERHLPSAALAALLWQSEAMERHIAKCGELLEAMDRIPPDGQAALLRDLIAWRESGIRWTELTSQKLDEGP